VSAESPMLGGTIYARKSEQKNGTI
jgi:hypothetical protein